MEAEEEIEEEPEPTPDCWVCGGETYLLGALGHRRHYRCRSCGMDGSEGPD